MPITYQQCLEAKRHSVINKGIEPLWIPDKMFDHQCHVAELSIRRGRFANFLDTGLGKTLIELVIAANYAQSTNGRVLILTPLAVAFQFLKDAERFGIDDVEHSKDGKFTKKIIVCNYERLHYFNPDDFVCVICDESSILKNFDGATKAAVTAFMRKVKYRFMATATPSPNDFIELGTSSEALGVLGYMDVLKQFFGNNENNVRPQDIGTKWYLKPHAKKAFFDFVASWSVSMRKPSDLGFDDHSHILPDLNVRYNAVKNNKNWVVNGQAMLFNIVAQTMTEVKIEQQMTIEERCQNAVELAPENDFCVYWCNFNKEGDLIKEIDPQAEQIKGGMKLEEKEELLLAFADGQVKHLITKPKITSFGLNWQHCNHTVFFPTFSYEQYYQAIRRFWRFGQTRPVTVDMVYSDGQKRVLDAILQKTEKMNDMFSLLNQSMNGTYQLDEKKYDKQILLPNFLK